MQRITTSDNVSVLPAPATAGASPGYFAQSTNPLLQTTVSPDWVNNVQEELIAILTAAGITPSVSTTNQVITAIETIIATDLAALATSSSVSTETARAEAAEATKGSLTGANTWTNSNIFNGGVSVTAATAAYEPVRLDQLLAPQALANAAVFAGGATGNTSVSLTIPGPGILIASGSRNNSETDTATGIGELLINGVMVGTDNTKVSMTLFGAVGIASAGGVTAEMAANAGVPFSVNVCLTYIPTL